jgi:hypothetical protein
MDDFDPTTADSLDDLAACLRNVHLRADKPTYRALEQQTIYANEFLPGTRLRRVRLSRSTLSDVLLGRKFPSKAFMLTFLDACGINPENDQRWEQAWDRLAIRYQQGSPPPEGVERVRQENGDLRAQLAEAEHRADQAHAEAERLRAELQALTAEHRAVMERSRSELDQATRAAQAAARAHGVDLVEQASDKSQLRITTIPGADRQSTRRKGRSGLRGAAMVDKPSNLSGLIIVLEQSAD